jgi:hypothetical protein
MRLLKPSWAAAQGGIDIVVAVVAALAWGLAAYVIAGRFVSPLAGQLLGMTVILSSGAMLLTWHLRDTRLASLAAGACPRCHADISSEHRHRRWDPGREQWTSPDTTWECTHCTFVHQESWSCPACKAQRW